MPLTARARTARNLSLALLGIKAGMVAVSALGAARLTNMAIPPSSTGVRLVALCFIASSALLLWKGSRLGLWSTLCVGALTGYSALTALFTGSYVAWSTVAFVTSLLLLVAVAGVWFGRPARSVEADQVERTYLQ